MTDHHHPAVGNHPWPEDATELRKHLEHDHDEDVVGLRRLYPEQAIELHHLLHRIDDVDWPVDLDQTLSHLTGAHGFGFNDRAVGWDLVKFHKSIHDDPAMMTFNHTHPPVPVIDWPVETILDRHPLLVAPDARPPVITITKGGQGCTWPWLWHALVDRAGDEQHFVGLTRCAVMRKTQRARRQ
jgi:hypothetical protein